MYSAKIFGEPTTFGTSGLLYRSNKLMYDRLTNTIWHQFTGEPVIGPLADSGIKLDFFPSLLTTWQEWVAEHPDTTVLSLATGYYPGSFYLPESDPDSIYFGYRNTTDPMFPVWNLGTALSARDLVLGLGIGGAYKAYPVSELQRERVVNDELGGTEVVIIAGSATDAARAYRRDGRVFSAADDNGDGLTMLLLDAEGDKWTVTEEFLTSLLDPSEKLERISTTMSYWLGWISFHSNTEIYVGAGE